MKVCLWKERVEDIKQAYIMQLVIQKLSRRHELSYETFQKNKYLSIQAICVKDEKNCMGMNKNQANKNISEQKEKKHGGSMEQKPGRLSYMIIPVTSFQSPHFQMSLFLEMYQSLRTKRDQADVN